jgi:hypothetical protein
MICDSTRLGKKNPRIPATTVAGFRPPTKLNSGLLLCSIGLSQSITQTHHLRSVVPCRNVTRDQACARILLLFFPLPPGSKCQRAYGVVCNQTSNLVLFRACLSKLFDGEDGEERVGERRQGLSWLWLWLVVWLVPKAEARLRCEKVYSRQVPSGDARPRCYPAIGVIHHASSACFSLSPFPCLRLFVYKRQESLINDRMKKLPAADGTLLLLCCFFCPCHVLRL